MNSSDMDDGPNRYQSLERLLMLDRLLYQNRYRRSELASMLTVSGKTISRDLEALTRMGAHVRSEGLDWWSERVAFTANLGCFEERV